MTGEELQAVWRQDWPSISRHLDALIGEAIASDAYDAAECVTQRNQVPFTDRLIGGFCVGENHIETCPVLIAWQDRKAASEKRRGM